MKDLAIKEEFAKKALEYLESAEAFTAEHMPIYVEELLKYKMIEELCVIALTTVPLAAIGFLYWLCFVRETKIYVRNKAGKIDWENSIRGPANECAVGSGAAREHFTAAAVFCLIIFVIVFVPALLDVIKINVAPRVYLIEYLQKLL